MKEVKISLVYKGKRINLIALEMGLLGKFRGLMFKRIKNASILFFDFKKPVKIPFHSFFVFFPFLAIWLDNKNNILEKRVVYPFNLKININKNFYKVIEIPFDKKYLKILKLLDEY